MAWPAPPLIKLSIADKIITLFLYLVLQITIEQLFVLITSFVLNKDVNIKNLERALNAEYSKSRFVKILKTNTLLSTNDVINTNNCSIAICKTKYKNRIVILSVIDNLIKGGAGQAIQNMNLRFNFPEDRGL